MKPARRETEAGARAFRASPERSMQKAWWNQLGRGRIILEDNADRETEQRPEQGASVEQQVISIGSN
eukprot:2631376-Pleurochrysis_carterae.AAC.2